ncbi:MAG TPA: DUF6777 domain-containing protein [Acidimicrobiia bacterium]
MPPPASPTGPARSPLTIVVVIVVVVALVLGGALAVVLLSGDDEAAASEVLREPVSSSGANPFMQSVGTDQEDVTPPPDTGGTFEGGTPGLYGGTMQQGSCDSEQLVTFLEANPDKASAWAGVLGISVSEIRSYVAKLTPVILRSDVYVTNHGFVNGRATVIPAVLQAGTAVLVDEYGFPVVKCYCGNPLTKPPPRTPSVTYRGPTWPGFTQTNITIVQQTTVVINIYTLVDPTTNQPFGRPAGTDGDDDGPAPEDQGTSTTSSTRGRGGIPTNAAYSITISANCPGLDTTVLVSATLANGTLTFSGGGDSVSGPVNADGSFNIPIPEFPEIVIVGTLDADRLHATLDFEGCSIALDGTRSG